MSHGKAAFIFGAVVGVLLVGTNARAQDATSGAIAGVVRDKLNHGAPLNGVLVVVTSPVLAEAQTTMTEGKGQYKISNLPPGVYLVKFYTGSVTAEYANVVVSINHTTPVHTSMDLSKGGVVYRFSGKAPHLDPTTSDLIIKIPREYLDHVPTPGRTIVGALGVTPGSYNDGVGPAFSGSTSLENRVVLDGVDVTGITYGNIGSTVVTDFVEQIDIITGGYNAEYGRSTGGIVTAVTKQGTNEFHGSVFSYVTPGFLVAARERTPTEASSIDTEANLAYTADFGVELGGPIIKDKLWFYVGFAPQFSRTDVVKITKRRTDCRILLDSGKLSECRPRDYGDGVPDEDPDTGFLIYEDLDRRTLHSSTQTYYTVSKLNYAANRSNQGQVSLLTTPAVSESAGVRGDPAATSFKTNRLTTDLAAKWTSKLNNDKTTLELVFGWHHSAITSGSIDPTANDVARQNIYYGNLGVLSQLGFESQATARGCADGASSGDPYPFIENCPDEGLGYAIGGPGGLLDTTEDRLSLKLSGTQRLRWAGDHEIKAGADVEDNRLTNVRHISGGAVYDIELAPSNRVTEMRWVQLGREMNAEFDQLCHDDNSDADHACKFLGRSPVAGRTINWSAYLRDSWQPWPNLTLNLGLRYEEQRLRYAEHLQNTTDPLTGERLGTNAMVMKNMWAPRAGFAYDWSKVGRSKIFGHWGRFYESIPMDINNRSFGGETLYQRVWDAQSQCGSDPITSVSVPCGQNGERPANGQTVFGSGVLVAPGVRPQFLDEAILGVEYAVADDIKLGATLQYRTLGRVLEDVSVDNAETYILANPGEWSASAENDMVARIAATTDSDERARLEGQLEQFRKIRNFDRPRRDYMALQLTASKQFSKRMFAQASYTYSRTQGNFPGLLSSDNGQVDPNISSQYDLIELLANRDGPLPQDRPHYFKLDGYYRMDLKRAGILTAGIRLRALSGTPINALARHYLYGRRESFLLPRGAQGRGDFDYRQVVRGSYGRRLDRGMSLEVFADVFNVFNSQGTFSVSQEYTTDSVNPIVGGDYSDLVWAKRQSSGGAETPDPVTRHRNFGNPTVRYAPLSVRLGAKLRF